MTGKTYSNRYEIKYLVEARRQEEIEHGLLPFLEPDGFNGECRGYFNYSIYFDSPHYAFYSEKREGELTRIKPRIRISRSQPDDPPTTIYLELKGRYDRIVAKRRTPIDRELAEHLLSHGPIDLNGHAAEGSAAAEFLYLANRFNLAPCVTVPTISWPRTPLKFLYPRVISRSVAQIPARRTRTMHSA